MRYETIVPIQHHLNFPMTVDVEPDIKGVHIEVSFRAVEPSIAMPPTLNAPTTFTTEPAPQGSTPTSGTPDGTLLLNREKFAIMDVKLERVDRQLASLLDELPTFVTELLRRL
ncbi:hypothetical protein HAX54_000702 [Datura stramonium]|uniref:Uncharacterized protein n=1 Tax=Datura stramonium TaxID=4076 RepID=A0ABS8T1E7_DATST|nr:hypothetical protein [Datura stramonium]